MHNYFISLLLAFILLGVFVSPATAQLSQNCRSNQGGYCVELAQTYVPGLEFLKISKTAEVGELLSALYYFLIGVVGLSAFIAFTVGGVMYLFSAGSEKMTSQGRAWMWNAVYGLAIAMISWLILYTINPDLVLQLNLQIKPISGSLEGTPIPQIPNGACASKTTGQCTSNVVYPDGCGVCSSLTENCILSSACTGPLPATWYYQVKDYTKTPITKTCKGPLTEADCRATSKFCMNGWQDSLCGGPKPP